MKPNLTNFALKEKKPYRTPRLIIQGTVDEIAIRKESPDLQIKQIPRQIIQQAYTV